MERDYIAESDPPQAENPAEQDSLREVKAINKGQGTVNSMNRKNKGGIVANGIIISYGLIETVKYVQIIPTMLANILGCFLGALSIVYIVIKHGVNKLWRIFFFVCAYEVLGFISCIYNGNMDIQELLWVVFFMGIALVLLLEDISNRAAAIPVYLFCAVLAFYLATVGRIYELNTSESRNYVSVYLLSFYSIYVIVRYKNNEKAVPWMALICSTIISYLSLGRGGILAFTIIVALSVIYGMGKWKKQWGLSRSRVLFVIMIILAMCIFWKSIYYFLLSGLQEAAFFLAERGFKSNARLGIWGDYFKKILSSPIHFLVAPEISGPNWLSIYSSNLHNSYLMLYARYGLPIFAMIIFLVIVAFKWHMKEKNWIICIVFIGILLRCFTDVICFNGVIDISLYYLIFSPFYNKFQRVTSAKNVNKKS